MRLAFMLAGAALLAASAHADILPAPDRGPASATVAGLEFAVVSVQVRFPPGYTKSLQVVKLTGCVERHPNCKLAKSKNVIGMEVSTVNGDGLRPELGMVQQIVDAFRHGGSVTIELFSRGDGRDATKVTFTRR